MLLYSCFGTIIMVSWSQINEEKLTGSKPMSTHTTWINMLVLNYFTTKIMKDYWIKEHFNMSWKNIFSGLKMVLVKNICSDITPVHGGGNCSYYDYYNNLFSGIEYFQEIIYLQLCEFRKTYFFKLTSISNKFRQT